MNVMVNGLVMRNPRYSMVIDPQGMESYVERTASRSTTKTGAKQEKAYTESEAEAKLGGPEGLQRALMRKDVWKDPSSASKKCIYV